VDDPLIVSHCGAVLHYTGTSDSTHICRLSLGHRGPHWDDAGMAWTQRGWLKEVRDHRGQFYGWQGG
jgi:hypothetical protein